MIFEMNPVEQTTAITDLFMGLVAICLVYAVLKIGSPNDKTKACIWSSAFACIAFASICGVIAHGLVLSQEMEFFLWQPLNLALGLAVGFFFIGVVYDLFNKRISWILVLIVLLAAFIFYFISYVSKLFIFFILYEGLALLFAFFVYSYFTLNKKMIGAGYIAAGILISIIAAVIQALGPFQIKLYWTFNHNGIFHLIQIVGLLVIFLGLRTTFLNKNKSS